MMLVVGERALTDARLRPHAVLGAGAEDIGHQVEALRDPAGRFPLDTGRVAVRAASSGGHLSTLAVLRRPDVFHAAVVHAPVTDWRPYDTHYTERCLGAPGATPDVYAANPLVTDPGCRQRASRSGR